LAVSDLVTERPAICLNMIVRNEAHIVREVLDAVAPHISSWVIVDTGSNDGTQDLIRGHMASLGIPGELHDRPWRNFGHNRTEALTLAQGHGEYIWVIDADDTVVGTLDLEGLGADICWLRHGGNDDLYWRPQLFRDGVDVHYQGVVHEHAAWDYGSCAEERVAGDYHIESRRLGARNLDPQKYEGDRDLLLAEVERNPEDVRSVFYLAQSYFDLGDFSNARTWYARRAEMGEWEEEVYFAMWRVAESMAFLGEPWPDVQDAYLRAWEFRPTRAEPLYCIARRYREDFRYQLGYHFAQRAAEIPFPEHDHLFIRADIYAWRALDEHAVCASWVAKQPEAFTLFRQLVARPALADADRQRSTGNRDVCVPTMIDAAADYPEAVVETLVRQLADTPQADVTVSLIAGPHLEATEQTLNSFLHCCTDRSKVGQVLVLDAGLSTQDRVSLQKRYGFLEFLDARPGDGPGAHLAQIRAQVHARFWLHLAQGWRFFAPDNLLTRLTAVLEAEPDVFQVAINFTDATNLTGTCAPEQAVRRTPEAGRYLLTDTAAHGPAMFDTTRLPRAGDLLDSDPDPLIHLDRRAAAAGLRTATLDEVLCISGLEHFRDLPWTTSAADIINELLIADAGRHFAEISTDGPSAYFAAVTAESKVSVPHARFEEDSLAADPPEGGYDVIFVDTWREPKHSLDIIERCLPKLSATGALVVDGSNPPCAWHQRLSGESEPKPLWDGQVRQAVIEFRVLHPQCQVFTVEASWGCTVIRPSRGACHELGSASVDRPEGAAFERERRLLNLVSVARFRDYLDAD
jgi:glycosyltransferase involved in cell wall biosynthesis